MERIGRRKQKEGLKKGIIEVTRTRDSKSGDEKQVELKVSHQNTETI